jgi:hypothetical protein
VLGPRRRVETIDLTLVIARRAVVPLIVLLRWTVETAVGLR